MDYLWVMLEVTPTPKDLASTKHTLNRYPLIRAGWRPCRKTPQWARGAIWGSGVDLWIMLDVNPNP